MKKMIAWFLLLLLAGCVSSHHQLSKLEDGVTENPDSTVGGLIGCTPNPDGTLPAGCVP